MSSLERIKKILLGKNKLELGEVNTKISEIEAVFSKEKSIVDSLKAEIQKLEQDVKDVKKTMLSEEELEDFKTIYDFLKYYETIKKILDIIQKLKIPQIKTEIYMDSGKYYTLEIERRKKLCEILQQLNSDITKLILVQGDRPKKESKLKMWINAHLRKKRISFNKFKEIIDSFLQKYNDFITADFKKIDRTKNLSMIATVKKLSKQQKKGILLDEEEQDFLYSPLPHELWEVIEQYYEIIGNIVSIIEKFKENFERYKALYEQRPELFDIDNLERTFDENNRKQATLEALREKITTLNKEKKKRNSLNSLKAELEVLEGKKKKLEAKADEIERAKTFQDLGYKDKKDAVERLKLESKDYLVIPVPETAVKVSDLFQEEKQIKVEIGNERTFWTSYLNNTVEGRINAIEDNGSISACILVPISELRKDDIDSARNGIVVLNKSILGLRNIVFLGINNRHIDFEGLEVECENFLSGTLYDNLKKFLGEDFLNISNELADYEIFRNIPKSSSKERQMRRIAIRNGIFQNLNREVCKTDTILVDDEPYYLDKNDEHEMGISKKEVI